MLLKRPSVQSLFNGYNYDAVDQSALDKSKVGGNHPYVSSQSSYDHQNSVINKSTNNTSTTNSTRIFFNNNIE